MDDEKMIKNSVDPVNISGTKTILNQMTDCICKIKVNSTFGTGFFCKIPYENKNINVLMTNYHIIDDNYYQQNKEIYLFLNDEKELKIIKLDKNRKTYFNKDYDIAMIELVESDNINNYLELDDNLFKDEIRAYFKDISIYILHYPFGKQASVSYGISIDIMDNEIKHICSTEHGSSGSPILNLSNNKIIGIHKQGSIRDNFNIGVLLKFPINDFLRNDTTNYKNINLKNKLINENINNNFNEALNDILNEIKLTNLKYYNKNTIGITFINYGCVVIEIGRTVGEALKLFYRKLNYSDVKVAERYIVPIYNAKRIRLEDDTPVGDFFPFMSGTMVRVLNAFNDFPFDGRTELAKAKFSYEEMNIIEKEKEKLLSEIEIFNIKKVQMLNEEKRMLSSLPIRIKIRAGDNSFYFTISRKETVANLIKKYLKRRNLDKDTLYYNSYKLESSDTSTLEEKGLEDGSVVESYLMCEKSE